MTRRQRIDGMNLKEQLAAGASPAGSWLSLSSPAAAEAVGGLGFDFLMVDVEHTPLSVETAEDLVRAVDAAGDTDVLVRVAENDPIRIKRALDTGAAGIMAPQINSVDEAEALVEAASYPPEGIRGIAGSRANAYGADIDSSFHGANDEIAVLAQIESEAALPNVHDIAGVAGVDALFLGPADLSADMGCFGEYDDPAFSDAVDRVLDAGRMADVPVGTIATADEEIDMWHERGMDFLVVGTDMGYLTSGAKAAKERYESLR